jgi:transposase-like protein
MCSGKTLSSKVIFVTDGGKGLIKCLRDKFGKNLLLQRCTIHKDRNLQKHVAKKHRKDKISQRWLAAVFVKAEETFRTVKGFEEIKSIVARIGKIQNESIDKNSKLAA